MRNIRGVKEQYSVYVEFQLDEADFGREQAHHFKLCNERLLEFIEEARRDQIKELYGCRLDQLRALIKVDVTASPQGFIWHYATSDEAAGRLGVMRLVPVEQQNKLSIFCNLLHPDKDDRDGYYEWAIPSGAPNTNAEFLLDDWD